MAELTQSQKRVFGKKASFKDGKSEQADSSAGASPLCPQCNSSKVWRDGTRESFYGDSIQRWSCRQCGYRFSDPNDLQKAQSTIEKVEIKLLKAAPDKVFTRQICVEETKNLAAEQEIKQVPRRNEVEAAKGKIIEHAFWMQKEGYSENTIERRIRMLQTLNKRGANLLDPENVKEAIAKQTTWALKTKEIAVETYSCFLKTTGGTWKPPKYKPVRKLPFIPTEQELNQLIAGCNKKTATFLQLLKETGARCGEAWQLNWIDLDFENKTVRITPEKGSEPRQLKISDRLIAMLNSLPKERSEVFKKGQSRIFHRTFRQQRKRIAIKLQNERIHKITFHTFRHWKATTEYAKTKDILRVMKMLGHKSIQNTLLYTQLVNFENDEFHSATAKTVEEAQKLVEAGFEFVCNFEEIKLFRKRK